MILIDNRALVYRVNFSFDTQILSATAELLFTVSFIINIKYVASYAFSVHLIMTLVESERESRVELCAANCNLN